MKVLQKNLSICKTDIFKLKNKQGNIISNQDEILRLGEEVYNKLYKSRQPEHPNIDTLTQKQGIVNQESVNRISRRPKKSEEHC